MIVHADAVAEVQELVRSAPSGTRLVPVGGQTKPALSAAAMSGVEPIDLSGLNAITEYDPAELTVTALAGTPVAEVAAALAEHGQYLPFDPVLAAAGATLGGSVAAAASGPGALSHGGVRDFIIGVRFIDGTGRLVSGGGKVVKNAAGFDLPKLLCGSIGRLGVIVSLSFKVFPRPPATATLAVPCDDLPTALVAVGAFMRSPVELAALDVDDDATVLARIAGRSETLAARCARLAGAVDASAVRTLEGPDEAALWSQATELAWRGGDEALLRVGLSIRQVPALAGALTAAGLQARVRYSLGGSVAWISSPAGELTDLDRVLGELGLPGVGLFGPRARFGPRTGGAFATRVKAALDPSDRFLEV